MVWNVKAGNDFFYVSCMNHGLLKVDVNGSNVISLPDKKMLNNEMHQGTTAICMFKDKWQRLWLCADGEYIAVIGLGHSFIEKGIKDKLNGLVNGTVNSIAIAGNNIWVCDTCLSVINKLTGYPNTQKKFLALHLQCLKILIMDLVLPVAEQYAAQFTTKTDALLNEIYQHTLQNHADPQMISGPVQGKFLEMISSLIQPQYILEVGSFVGYSAICLAKGLRAGGELHTIEMRDVDADTCAKNFVAANMQHQIHLHRGNALEIIPLLHYNWDLVFIDADKPGYIAYYEMVLPRLSDNGVIIADNTLFHGQVLGENISGKNALAIDAFNKHVAADERTEQVMLTIRDGIMLIKKKN